MVFDFKPPKNVNGENTFIPLEIGRATSTKLESTNLLNAHTMLLRESQYLIEVYLNQNTLQIFEEDGHLYLKLISAMVLKCKAYGVQASVRIRNSKSSVPYLMVLKLLLRIHR